MGTFMNVKKIFIFSGLVYSNIFGTDVLNFFGNFAKDNELAKEGLAICFKTFVGNEYYGNNDIGKLIIFKSKINLISPKIGLNCDKIVDIFNKCNFEELKSCDPTEIKSYILSTILFCGDQSEEDIIPNNKEKNNVVIMFHGMGDDTKKFQNDAFFNEENGFDKYVIAYNKCGDLNNLDVYINKKVEIYYEALKNYDQIFIYGFSMGCLIANKFRDALIKKIKDNNKRIHFIFDKGFYDITKTQYYSETFSILKNFNSIFLLNFVDDTVSDNAIVELTSNFNILKNSGGNKFKYFIETTNANHKIASVDLLKKIYDQINKNENKTNDCIYFIDGGNNDEMVGSSPLRLYNALTNPIKEGGENVQEGFLDCCPCCNVPPDSKK